MKIVNLPTTERKDPNLLVDEMLELIVSYNMTIVEALGLIEIVKAELLEQIYYD